MEQTARFAFPLLVPGQLQRELFLNEAIQQMELLLCPAVAGIGLTTAPSGPEIGSCYLIPEGAAGEWAGHEGALACFTDGGWRFAGPFEGMQLIDRSSGQVMAYRSGAWESGIVRCQRIEVDGETVLGARQPAVADPSGGAMIDAECRAAVASLLMALRTHGLIC